jgi:hypothetical protein
MRFLQLPCYGLLRFGFSAVDSSLQPVFGSALQPVFGSALQPV